jgi:hypothetical protein
MYATIDEGLKSGVRDLVDIELGIVGVGTIYRWQSLSRDVI